MRIMWKNSNPAMRKSGANNLYVNRLATSLRPRDVWDAFAPFGEILSLKVPLNDTDPSLIKGFAYVQFEKAEAVDEALGIMGNGEFEFQGQKIKVEKYKKLDVSERKHTNVYVRNMPLGWSREYFREQFEKFGEITSVDFQPFPEGTSPDSRNGFVNFSTQESADAAIAAMNDVSVPDAAAAKPAGAAAPAAPPAAAAAVALAASATPAPSTTAAPSVAGASADPSPSAAEPAKEGGSEASGAESGAAAPSPAPTEGGEKKVEEEKKEGSAADAAPAAAAAPASAGSEAPASATSTASASVDAAPSSAEAVPSADAATAAAAPAPDAAAAAPAAEDKPTAAADAKEPSTAAEGGAAAAPPMPPTFALALCCASCHQDT